ncbi:MAG: carboxypeptidase regulatory-like domain-containing protein [Bacillales bacterium]|jgi:hypothetical protein|nr:carboxypeptidase regulatory-like domain-containing protein [Bacillales bacterium]
MLKKKLLTQLLLSIIAPLALVIAVIIPAVAVDYEDYVENKTPSDTQFDFPGNYEAPELTIDGIANEEEWINAPILATYSTVEVKAYRGEKALFFFFNVADTSLLTEGNANDDSVTRSDSIELYLDTLNDGGLKPQGDDYQFNFGIHNKTRIMQGSGSNWGNWNGLIDYEVKLDGTLNDGIEANDVGYAVEVMIPYAQINIQKEDTIGISFGRVNKFGLGSVVITDWNWYGWTYGGKLVEPQTIDNYVSYLADGTLKTRDELPMPNASITGTILNKLSQLPVEGVSIETGSLVTTTDANGYFVFASVDPELTYTFDVTKEGFYPTTIVYTRDELRASKGGVVNHTADMIEIATADKTTVTGKVVNIINGNVSGALVEVIGTIFTGTSDVSGNFEIADVPAIGSISLRISKTGHVSEIVNIPHEDIEVNATTDIAEVNLSLAYNSQAVAIGGARGINLFDVKITRALGGVRFHITTATKFEAPESVILYLQGGVTGTNKAVGLKFFGNGTIGFDKSANATFHTNNTSSISYGLVFNENVELGATIDIEVPYAYLYMTPMEPFGFSGGAQCYNTSGSLDWDGLGFDGFIEPNDPTAYLRIDYLNNIYKATSNAVKVTISGNTGVSGTVVKIGATQVVANSSGRYSIVVDKPLADITITFSAIGYTTLSEIIPAADFANTLTRVLDVSLSLRYVTVSGSVTDTSGTPLLNAVVEISADGYLETTTTDAEGHYTMSGVPTLKEVRVSVELSGYSPSFKTISVAVLNAEGNEKVVETFLLSTGIVSVSGTVTSLYGLINGAGVEVVGNGTATTGADGTFSITNVGMTDLTINISKSKYKTETILVPMTSLTNGANYDLGNVDLKLAEASLGVFANKSANFSAFSGYVTRGISALEFRFQSSKDVFVTGDRIELFVSSKTTTTGARGNGDYLFNLNATGAVSIVDWGASPKNETSTATLNVSRVPGSSTTVRFSLPYAFFGQKGEAYAVAPSEVIGFSIGQWSSVANDWDGWNFTNSGQSIANDRFVTPERSDDYVRLSRDNILYQNTTNNTFNFADYSVQFGTDAENTALNADRFFASVSKDGSGITFNFAGLGTFTNDELVLLYLDIDDTRTGGWDVDRLYKIRGNGKVYMRNNNVWWSAGTADEVGSVEISRANGLTTFSLTLSFETLGITSEQQIGFALREALHNAGDHQLYDPWFDCYFSAPLTDSYYSQWHGFTRNSSTGIDAANEAQYVQIGASGNLFRL